MGNAHPQELLDTASPLGASRLAQLKRDLLRTSEERVRAAEETLKLDRLRDANIPTQVIGFDRYEDYLDYKQMAPLSSAPRKPKAVHELPLFAQRDATVTNDLIDQRRDDDY